MTGPEESSVIELLAGLRVPPPENGFEERLTLALASEAARPRPTKISHFVRARTTQVGVAFLAAAAVFAVATMLPKSTSRPEVTREILRPAAKKSLPDPQEPAPDQREVPALPSRPPTEPARPRNEEQRRRDLQQRLVPNERSSEAEGARTEGSGSLPAPSESTKRPRVDRLSPRPMERTSEEPRSGAEGRQSSRLRPEDRITPERNLGDTGGRMENRNLRGIRPGVRPDGRPPRDRIQGDRRPGGP